MNKEQIISDINNTPIILYIKGTKERPMCGFSARVVNILNNHSVIYKTMNICVWWFSNVNVTYITS